MTLTDVLIEPVVSEKASMLREQNKYVFIVRKDATKTDIKEAVAKLFNVTVINCTTMNVMGKVKRLRGKPGRTASFKKAVVRIADGQSISAFEGV
ncbi:MAG: 50S ribosomal protein L23 [Treponema sp.]|nr:50S ribosomal protein L23 [Treponema sp.]